MKQVVTVLFILSVLGLTGCGSVSGIKPTGTHQLSELTQYDKIIVTGFTNAEKCKEPERAKLACANFADRISLEIEKKGIVNSVDRTPSTEKALLITGCLTRYEEGNAMARLLVGCGAGSSYLDVDIEFKDNVTQEQLATLKVDKNSWGLGGGIAAGQTIEAFMDEAAKKLAEQLMQIKKGET
jgi:opacity protein-like surface antigen